VLLLYYTKLIAGGQKLCEGLRPMEHLLAAGASNQLRLACSHRDQLIDLMASRWPSRHQSMYSFITSEDIATGSRNGPLFSNIQIVVYVYRKTEIIESNINVWFFILVHFDFCYLQVLI
jgi:hypothetical protein